MLLLGAILAPGQRTVASILRIIGLGRERRFVSYHRVLNRAAWSGRAVARVLLGLLLDAFLPYASCRPHGNQRLTLVGALRPRRADYGLCWRQ